MIYAISVFGFRILRKFAIVVKNMQPKKYRGPRYEILLLLVAGLRPRDIIKGFQVPSGTVYRWSRIHARARKRLQTLTHNRNSVPPGGRKRVKNLGARKKRKKTSGGETTESIRVVNGITVVRVAHNHRSDGSSK